VVAVVKMLVTTYVGHMWTVFQPLLFGLIGAEVSLKLIQPSTVGLGLAVLFIGLVLRVIVSFFVVMGLRLTIREQLFVALAWLPKATVQVRSWLPGFVMLLTVPSMCGLFSGVCGYVCAVMSKWLGVHMA